jgi:hypothetical protein
MMAVLYYVATALIRPGNADGHPELSGVPYTDHALLTTKNHLDWSSPKLYVYTVLNVSVTLAFFGLMKFYYATSTQLAWCDPW